MTAIFGCSGGCLITGRQALLSPQDSHWSTGSGTAPTITTGAGAGAGGFGIRWDYAAASGYLQKAMVKTEVTKQFKILFPTLPNADCVFWIINLSAGTPVEFEFLQATSSIRPKIGAQLGVSHAIVAGQQYTIDFKYVQTLTTTSTLNWSVDGVDKGQVQLVQGSVLATSSWRVGAQSAITGSVVFTDIFVDDDDASYPLPAGLQGIALVPTADGVHNFNAAGDLKYNNTTNIAPGASDVFSFIDHKVGSVSDFISFNAVAVNEGVRVKWGGMPGASQILGVEAILAAHAAGTAANKLSSKLFDGAQQDTWITDADLSQTTICNRSVHFPTRIGGLGAWTPAALNALETEVVSSYTAVDLADIPFLDGLVLEVFYVPQNALQVFPEGLRMGFAMPEGLEGFDRDVELDPADRVGLHYTLGVPTFVVDGGEVETPADPTFTAESVILAARDRHSSFDKQRHPTASLLRFLDQYQRHLLGEAIQRDVSFMAASHTVPMPLADHAAGYALPFVYHVLHGGDCILAGGQDRREFNMVPYGRRHGPIPFYGGWVLGTRLYLRGEANDWIGVEEIQLSYVPEVSRLSSLRASLQLPRSAEAPMVEACAAYMAGRGHRDPQLPEINEAAFIRRATAAEANWLDQIGRRRQVQVKYVKEVW